MDEIGGDPGATFPANGFSGLCDLIDRNISRVGHRLSIVHEFQSQGMLRASGLLLGLLGLLLLLVLPALTGWILRRTGRMETNFRGDRIPQSFGLVTLVWSGLMFCGTAFLYSEQRARALLWAAGCCGYGLLGLLDDTFGTKQIKGLRGHIRAALREHVVTTGLIKAVGGALMGLWLGARFMPGNPSGAVLAGAVIALSANAVNLLDLRPGRAGAAFLVCAAPLVAVALLAGQAGAPPLLLVIIPALRVWEPDAHGKVMMGDTGSNLLGAALGMGIVTTTGTAAQIVVLIGLVALHLLAERRSITTIIQGSRVLNALDRLTGVR